MRVPVCESFLQFDLPPGSRHHEDVNPNHSAGVDLEIAVSPPLWLEVKNWNAPVIPPEKRAEVDADYVDKTATTSTFWDSMVKKFEGTHTALAVRQELPANYRLGLLLESRLFETMALAPMISVLEAKLAVSQKITGLQIGIVTAATFGSYIKDSSAKPCPVSPFPECNCSDNWPKCSAKRRKHKE